MLTRFDLHRLEAGYRCCTSCGKPEIRPDEPPYKTMCGGCFLSTKGLTFDQKQARTWNCTSCGGPVETDRANAILARGGRIYDCLSCWKDENANVPSSKRAALISSLAA